MVCQARGSWEVEEEGRGRISFTARVLRHPPHHTDVAKKTPPPVADAVHRAPN